MKIHWFRIAVAILALSTLTSASPIPPESSTELMVTTPISANTTLLTTSRDRPPHDSPNAPHYPPGTPDTFPWIPCHTVNYKVWYDHWTIEHTKESWNHTMIGIQIKKCGIVRHYVDDAFNARIEFNLPLGRGLYFDCVQWAVIRNGGPGKLPYCKKE